MTFSKFYSQLLYFINKEWNNHQYVITLLLSIVCFLRVLCIISMGILICLCGITTTYSSLLLFEVLPKTTQFFYTWMLKLKLKIHTGIIILGLLSCCQSQYYYYYWKLRYYNQQENHQIGEEYALLLNPLGNIIDILVFLHFIVCFLQVLITDNDSTTFCLNEAQVVKQTAEQSRKKKILHCLETNIALISILSFYVTPLFLKLLNTYGINFHYQLLSYKNNSNNFVFEYLYSPTTIFSPLNCLLLFVIYQLTSFPQQFYLSQHYNKLSSILTRIYNYLSMALYGLIFWKAFIDTYDTDNHYYYLSSTTTFHETLSLLRSILCLKLIHIVLPPIILLNYIPISFLRTIVVPSSFFKNNNKICSEPHQHKKHHFKHLKKKPMIREFVYGGIQGLGGGPPWFKDKDEDIANDFLVTDMQGKLHSVPQSLLTPIHPTPKIIESCILYTS